jgi:MobA/MobL family
VAIYHWQMKTMSRSQGRSATAAAAYRSGQAITDERTGQVFDYSKRSGVMFAEVVMPDGGTSDREALWNAAETTEKRCNSVVAREIVVALPHELRRDEQEALVKDYAQRLSERTGWAVDLAIHAPGKEGDIRNIHAHLLCTTRNVSRDVSGCPVMGSKTREWDIRSSGSELIRSERTEWEQHVNRALQQEKIVNRVDCRSHAEKGSGLEPQVHLGVAVMGMERKGIQTERGDEHRRIAAHNDNVIQLAEVREQKVQEERVFAAEQAAIKQEEREAQAWWKVRYGELEQMTIWEIERTIIYPPIFPRPTHETANKHPKVEPLKNKLEQAVDGVQQAERWVTQMEGDVEGVDFRRGLWQAGHPHRTWLHTKGILEAKELVAFDAERQKAKESVVEARANLKGWQAEQEKRQALYRAAYKSVLPAMEREKARREKWYAQANALVKERRHLREKGLYKEPDRGRGLSL